MLEKAKKQLLSFFGGEDAALTPPLSDDGHIHFNDSNRRIFNSFFKIISFTTFFATIAIILYYVYAYASLYNGTSKFDWLLGIFSDFVVIMDFSLEESPYVVGDSSYPPIAIAILYPFALICKDVFAMFRSSELTADELTAEIIIYPQFWIAIILFFIICSVLIILLTSRLFGLRVKDTFTLGSIILLSAPFVFTVMRGNTIYFALIFLVAFLLLRRSENPVLREISYFCLAMAGAIKIYPLFFGVFLLKDKKILASIRVAVYFVAIFWLSFFFFKNGLDNVTPFLEHLGDFASSEDRLLGTNNISISAQLYKLLHLLVPSISDTSAIYKVLSVALMIITFLLSTYTAIVTKKDLSRYIICFGVVTLIPTISYFYTIIFAVIPFLEYIRRFTELSMRKRIYYFVSFNILFITPLVFGINFILQSVTIISLLTVEIVTVILERREIWVQKRSAA